VDPPRQWILHRVLKRTRFKSQIEKAATEGCRRAEWQQWRRSNIQRCCCIRAAAALVASTGRILETATVTEQLKTSLHASACVTVIIRFVPLAQETLEGGPPDFPHREPPSGPHQSAPRIVYEGPVPYTLRCRQTSIAREMRFFSFVSLLCWPY
jgi:hypothetical protein